MARNEALNTLGFKINRDADSDWSHATPYPYYVHLETYRKGRRWPKEHGGYFLKNAEDLRQHCERMFDGTRKVTITGCRLPSEGPSIILDYLLTQSQLLFFKGPDDLFTKEQASQLQMHILHNRAKEQRKELNNLLYPIVTFGGSLTVAFAYCFFGLTQPHMGVWFAGAATTYVAVKAHQAYLKFASRYYNTAEKIAAITLPSERAALLAGLQVKRGEYFRSFLLKETWQNPLAFAAGFFFALSYNYEMQELIKTTFTNADEKSAPSDDNPKQGRPAKKNQPKPQPIIFSLTERQNTTTKNAPDLTPKPPTADRSDQRMKR